MVFIDSSELDKLAADLESAAKNIGPKLVQAIETSARNIKDDWKEQASGMAHAPRFPHSITYDIGANHSLLRNVFGGGGANEIIAQIGPDKDRPQGALGNLIEFGSINNPPMGLGHGALNREEAGFQRGLEQAVDEAMKEADL